jgi:hypothetical protein
VRRALDRLYDAAAWLAALCMIGTLAMVLLGIASRLFNWFVPGTDAYAGYFMAARASSRSPIRSSAASTSASR